VVAFPTEALPMKAPPAVRGTNLPSLTTTRATARNLPFP
jgi:hypothetical protein